MPSVITAGTATNTALNLSSDTSGELQIRTNNGATTAMTLTTGGDVGIGTSSPTRTLDVNGNMRLGTANGRFIEILNSSSEATYISQESSAELRINQSTSGANSKIAFLTQGSERMRIDSSGNVGIGTSSPTAKLEPLYTSTAPSLTSSSGAGLSVRGSSTVRLNVGSYPTSSFAAWIQASDNANSSYDIVVNPLGGNLLVGTTSIAENSGVGLKLISSSVNPSYRVVMNTATGGDAGFIMFNTNATNNGYRFFVKSDGGISNFSGNNSNLSDKRTKENIELAGDYLNKICSIPVKTFNYKDEPAGEQKTLGVIAQDVEAIAPELVNNEGFGESIDGEEPLKSVYTTDMMFAMMKAIQELKAELDEAKAEIQALKGAQ